MVSPNLGDDGGIILTIPVGGTYCAAFGGATGGTDVKDTAKLWKMTKPTSQGCPL